MKTDREHERGGLRGALLLWLIGVPIPVILVILLLTGGC